MSWLCSNCTFENQTGGKKYACGMCGHEPKGRSVDKDWLCPQCTFNNPGHPADVCEMCQAPRFPQDDAKAVTLPLSAPKLLHQTSSFLTAVQAALPINALALSPQMLKGIENLVKVPWKRCDAILSGKRGAAKPQQDQQQQQPTPLDVLFSQPSVLDVPANRKRPSSSSPASDKSKPASKPSPADQDQSQPPLAPEWSVAVRRALAQVALEKAKRSIELFRDMVDLCQQEEHALSTMSCQQCRRLGDQVTLVVNPSCTAGHPSCSNCLHDYVMDLVARRTCSQVKCPYPSCSKELDNRIIRSCLSAAEFEAFNEAALAEFIGGDATFIKCPNPKCNQVMEFVSNAKFVMPIIIPEKDDRGNTLTPAAYSHYMQHRVRCRECQTNFCNECRTTPYHKGFNCEDYKTFMSSKHCRFCHLQLNPLKLADKPPSPALAEVCDQKECITRRDACCIETLDCGHPCGGVRDEAVHLPCLNEQCAEKNNLKQKCDDYCHICFVEDLSAAPSIQLECGHIFHENCVVDKVKKGWPGVRITFGFLNCPLCKKEMKHPRLDSYREPYIKLYEIISNKSLARLEIEGMLKDDKLVNPASRFHNDRLGYAMASFAYYNCFKCKTPYFGGRRDCEQNADADNRPLNEFICFSCGDVVNPRACKIASHAEYILWKCRFCCNPAVWFCFGTTHFCEPCHSDNPMEKTRRDRSGFKQCAGKETCPLRLSHHSPNGKESECEFAIGCAMCTEEERKRQIAEKKEAEIEAKIASGSLAAPALPLPLPAPSVPAPAPVPPAVEQKSIAFQPPAFAVGKPAPHNDRRRFKAKRPKDSSPRAARRPHQLPHPQPEPARQPEEPLGWLLVDPPKQVDLAFKPPEPRNC